MTRYHIPLVVAAILAVGSTGQAQRPAPPQALPATVGVIVDRTAYEAKTRQLTIYFRNTGRQEVTAFGYLVTLSKPSVTPLRHHETIDLLPVIALRGTALTPGDPALQTSFAPQETYRVFWSVPVGWGNVTLSDLRCEPAGSIIYADSTALGDPKSIEEVFAARQEQVAALAEVQTQVATIPRDGRSGSQLSALRARAMAKTNAAGHREAEMLSVISGLHQQGGWEVVDKVLAAYRTKMALMSEQSHRKER